MNKRFFLWSGLLVMLLACNMGGTASPPNSDLLATLAASTPLTGSPAAPVATDSVPTSIFNLSTPLPSTVTVPTSSSTIQPTGKIVFTCQIFKVQASNQICVINADGTGFRRLTTDDTKQHYYSSISPDGWNVVYAAFREANVYELYEMNIANGSVRQLTNRLGILNAPEVSPDGKSIVAVRRKMEDDGKYNISFVILDVEKRREIPASGLSLVSENYLLIEPIFWLP